MQNLLRTLRGVVARNGARSILGAVSLIAVVSAGAFLLGFRSNGLGTSPAADTSSAELLAQTGLETIADVDGDSDGLRDLDEIRYRTDPTKADTDGDGFNDGLEVSKGFDPTAPPAEGFDQTTAEASGENVSSSLLKNLGYEEIPNEVDGLNVGGIGGLGGDPVDSVSSTERLGELEVDKLLMANRVPLPSIDAARVKKGKVDDVAAKEAYVGAAYGMVVRHNPFPVEYSISALISDIGANNRDQLEKTKLSVESVIRELETLEVPPSMVTPHVHTLQILEVAKSSLEQMLTTNGDPDATLNLLARLTYVVGETDTMLRELEQALQ